MSDTLDPVSGSTSCCDKATCCGGTHKSGDLKDDEREKYGEAAKQATSGAQSPCCDTSACCGGAHGSW